MSGFFFACFWVVCHIDLTCVLVVQQVFNEHLLYAGELKGGGPALGRLWVGGKETLITQQGNQLLA